MQRAIEIHPLDNYGPVEIAVTEPGLLRRVLSSAKPASSLVTAAGAAPANPMTDVPALMFEVDPSQGARKRKFIWLPGGTKITFPGTLEFRDTYLDEATGAPLILYEIMSAPIL